MGYNATIASRILLLGFLCNLCVGAGPPQHGQITKTAINSSALRIGQKAWAAVVVEVGDGYHAQSHTPLDENFIKFELKPRRQRVGEDWRADVSAGQD